MHIDNSCSFGTNRRECTGISLEGAELQEWEDHYQPLEDLIKPGTASFLVEF